MAWRSHGSSQSSLVDALIANRLIRTAIVATAFRGVDRSLFCPLSPADAYLDRPCLIGYGQTISAPHMHAACAEVLLERALAAGRAAGALRVLDVGSGSGFLTAVLALALPGATVVGIDVIPELVAQAAANLRARAGTRALLESGRLRLLCGDGWRGAPALAPFDLIHVGAAAEVLPPALLAQLAPGGRLICPVGVYSQQLMEVDKDARGRLSQRALMPVMYVPLVEK